jgi:predicted nucleic acid-binding Zn ribbon protein
VGDRLEEPVELGALLDPVGRRLGLESAADAGRLWSGWAEIVGSAVAGHAEPSSLRRGILRVRADCPTWATEVSYLAEAIRGSANAWLGHEAVREVRIWTGPGAVRSAAARRGKARSGAEGPARPLRSGADGDPQAALERARRAWAERRGRHPRGASAEPGQSGKSPW